MCYNRSIQKATATLLEAAGGLSRYKERIYYEQ